MANNANVPYLFFFVSHQDDDGQLYIQFINDRYSRSHPVKHAPPNVLKVLRPGHYYVASKHDVRDNLGVTTWVWGEVIEVTRQECVALADEALLETTTLPTQHVDPATRHKAEQQHALNSSLVEFE